MTGLFNNPRRHLRKLVKQKKYDEALEYGHEIEKKLEHDPDIAFIIGTIYYIKGDYLVDKTSILYNPFLILSKTESDSILEILAIVKNGNPIPCIKDQRDHFWM